MSPPPGLFTPLYFGKCGLAPNPPPSLHPRVQAWVQGPGPQGPLPGGGVGAAVPMGHWTMGWPTPHGIGVGGMQVHTYRIQREGLEIVMLNNPQNLLSNFNHLRVQTPIALPKVRCLHPSQVVVATSPHPSRMVRGHAIAPRAGAFHAFDDQSRLYSVVNALVLCRIGGC